MSSSTFDFKGYYVIAGTNAVMVACGFLAKTMEENQNKPSYKEYKLLVQELNNKATVDYGFILLELDQYISDWESSFIDIVDKTIDFIISFGKTIPLKIIKEIQSQGFFGREDKFINDMPTEYIANFLMQTRQMIINPVKAMQEQAINKPHYYIYKSQRSSAEIKFDIKTAFYLPSKKELVFCGEIINGIVLIGMQFEYKKENYTVSNVEFVDGKDFNYIGLVVQFANAEEANNIVQTIEKQQSDIVVILK
jgi:hypothetical protein